MILLTPTVAHSLNTLIQRLSEDFSAIPIIATEIEFYLKGASAHPSLESFEKSLRQALQAVAIPLLKFEKERGEEQYEIALAPMADAVQVAEKTAQLKHILRDIAAAFAMEADFAAKPFAGQPGSGLHVHLHLENPAGRALFTKENDQYSDALRHSIGGLLAALPGSMRFFAPHPASYARLTGGQEVPTTVSWGANNRTVAIRLPTKMPQESARHLEHRVPGADADPALAIAAILAGVHYGLSQRLEPPAPVYGNAFLPQYGLAPLPGSLEEAEQCWRSGILSGYF